MNRWILKALFILTALTGGRARASHLTASDLTVTYIGANATDLRYKVTLTIYGYCESGNANLIPNQQIGIKSTSQNYYAIKDLQSEHENADTLDQLCPAYRSLTSCYISGSIYPGYTRQIYMDTVILPARATDYVFSWYNLSRNRFATNIDPILYEITYIDAGLNNLFRVNNSTPVYQEFPLRYNCVNQPVNFINDPTDVDGDSLVTYNIGPKEDSVNAIGYLSGYSLQDPIGSLSGYRVNAITGTATFTASNTGKYVVAFRTDKYDRATKRLIAYTTRETQIPVLACTNPAPIVLSPSNITGGTLMPDGRISVAAGTALSFSLQGSGTAGNLLKLTADNASTAPGSTLSTTSNTGSNITGRFSWTPAVAAIGMKYVLFSLTDTSCNSVQPVLLRDAVVVPIEVLPQINTGINIYAGTSVLKVYPNPASNELAIESGSDKIENLTVYDMAGRVVLSFVNPGKNIPLNNLSAGSYLLKASGSFGASFVRFVKN